MKKRITDITQLSFSHAMYVSDFTELRREGPTSVGQPALGLEPASILNFFIKFFSPLIKLTGNFIKVFTLIRWPFKNNKIDAVSRFVFGNKRRYDDSQEGGKEMRTFHNLKYNKIPIRNMEFKN